MVKLSLQSRERRMSLRQREVIVTSPSWEVARHIETLDKQTPMKKAGKQSKPAVEETWA